MFKGRVVYKTPFGKGQRFLNKGELVDEAVGGWQASASIVWQSGNPFTPLNAQNHSYSELGGGSGTQVATVVPGVSPYAGGHHVGNGQSWFNPNAFSVTPNGAYGDAGRNSLRGPGLSDINFKFGKSFDISERAKFQLSFDATNILNHPSFGQPDNLIGGGHSGADTSVTVPGRTVTIIGRVSF
jgi:hypothetical protein